MNHIVNKLDTFLSKVITSKYTVISLSLMIFVLIFVMFFKEGINYTGLLKEIANINITIAIGLGAVSIAATSKILDTDYIWGILAMLLLGIFSYLLSVASLGELVSKLYFYANVCYVVKLISLFGKYFIQLVKNNNNNKPQSNNSSSKKSRK